MTTREEIVACARSWLGTPYRHQHRAKGIGADCVGLGIGVARELGLVPPDFDVTGYAPTPDGSIIEQCDRWMERANVMQPGDWLVISFGRLSGGRPQHMGILGDYLHGGLSLIHALATPTRARVIESRLVEGRNCRIVQAYAMPGVC